MLPTLTNKILAKIDQGIIIEETAVPIYKEHLETALFWSGMPEEIQRQITTYLNILVDDSEKHIVILKRIKEIITKK